MIDAHARRLIGAAESVAGDATLGEVMPMLRRLALDDFALLLASMPSAELPNLSKLLPRMPPEAEQSLFTGHAGWQTMAIATDFVRIFGTGLCALGMDGVLSGEVLDFGCGWGRFLRVMGHIVDLPKLYGCDPSTAALATCRRDGVYGNLAQSAHLPEALPFPGVRFDLVYSYSVFSHLSDQAAKTAAAAIRKHIAADGAFVFTVRPVEYWDMRARAGSMDRQHADEMARRHEADGLAHVPNAKATTQTYGDTTVSLDWLRSALPDWHLARYERSIQHRYQIAVFMRPA